MSHKPQSVRESESYIRSLLESQDLHGLAQTAVRYLRSLGCQTVHLAWNTEPSHASAEQSYPSAGIAPSLLALMAKAHQQGGLVEQAGVDAGRAVPTV